MRQIPKYLLVGSGRLAQHLSRYFHFSKLEFCNWSRSANNFSQLEEFLEQSDVVILAINDDAIENFIQRNPILKNKILVHCSGCLSLENVIGIHPLMSFGDELYDDTIYKKITFTIDSSVEDFKKYFPTFINPAFFINKKEKPYYHALCVMSGNFTTIIWSKLFQALEARFSIPKESAFAYLKSIESNLTADYKKALTGPLARGDKQIINKNLAALDGDNFLPIYKAFVNLFGEKNECK
jgi:predicted short-subunit dehydrogenase-like oxidoreductase (DUF2520 family)